MLCRNACAREVESGVCGSSAMYFWRLSRNCGAAMFSTPSSKSPVSAWPASRMCRAISRNVITSPTGLKSSSAAGKSSTACAVSCRTVFHDSSTGSVLIIGIYCNRRIELFENPRPCSMKEWPQESARVFQHPHDESCPAGLVAGSAPAPGVSVKIFVKPGQVAPVRAIREYAHVALPRAAAVLIREKNSANTPGQLARNLVQVHHSSRSASALDTQRVAVEMVIAFERLDQQIIQREPHRSPPVRVPAEQRRARFTRVIIHASLLAIHVQYERPVAMNARQRAYAVRR